MSNHIIQEDKALHAEIIQLHNKAGGIISTAKRSISDAFDITFQIGMLIEKYRLMHPHEYLGLLSQHIPANDIKRYESFFHRGIKKKKPNGEWITDKEQMVLAGVYEQSVNIGMRNVTPVAVSPIKYAMSFNGHLSKVITKRPVENMSSNEREQIKDVLMPVLEKFKDYVESL